MINTHKKIAVFAVFLVSILALPARAELLLNGVATHAELGKEMFIAGLYTTTPSTDRNSILLAQEEKQIQVRVTADKLSTRRFKRMWIEGMAVNASANELKEQSSNMAAFNNLLKVRMIRGDIFTVIRGGDSVQIIINGVELGEITDPRFFDLLLRTWLGPVPLSSDFRSALTKGGDIDSGLLARFNSTAPNDARIAEIEDALNSAPASAPQVAAARPAVSAPAITTPVVAAPSQPTINRPATSSNEQTVAIAPPRLENPDSGISPPSISNPQAAAPSSTQRPAAQAPAASSQPATPAPTQVAAAATTRSSILEEADDEEELTAESIYRQQLYVTELKAHSNNYLKYPRVALERGYEGALRLNVVINRDGSVVSTEFLEEAQRKSFNRAALKAVDKADPFPPVPNEVKGETFTFTLPIQFVLAQ